METNNAAAPAQDDTAPAAAASSPEPSAPSAPENAPPPAEKMELLLGDLGDGVDADANPGAVGGMGAGEYELAFPEGVVADAEAVAVLNRVGREFGVSGEKAQKLADAATAYANRRVDSVIDAGKKGYGDFVASEAKKTKEYYGPQWKTKLAEARLGLDRLLPDGVTIDDLRRDPNFQAITNVWWFAEMGRRHAALVSEQPSITGQRERARAKDLYSEYD